MAPENVPEQSPENEPVQSPENVPVQIQSPENEPEQSPENVPEQSLENDPVPKPPKDFGTAEQWREHFAKKRNDRQPKNHLKPLPWTLSSWPGNKPKKTVLPKLNVHVEEFETPASSLFWDEILQKLIFVVTETKTMFQYDPTNGDKQKVQGNWTPSFIFPVMGKSNKYVMGLDSKVVEAEWTNSVISNEKTLAELDMNIICARTDPIGRIVIGCHGCLAVLKPSEEIRKIYPLEYCTDLAWNINGSKMFVIRSRTGHEDHDQTDILEFKYDARTDETKGEPTVKKLQGSPRCLTVDMTGHLWVGCTNSSDLIVLNPDPWTVYSVFSLASLDSNIQTVISITFGDFAMDVLFLTTLNETKPKSADEGDTERDKSGKEDVSAKKAKSGKEEIAAEKAKSGKGGVTAEREKSGKEDVAAKGDKSVQEDINFEEAMSIDEGYENEDQIGIEGEMVEEDINENELGIKKDIDEISIKDDRNDIHIEEYTEGSLFSNEGDMNSGDIQSENSGDMDSENSDNGNESTEDESSFGGDGKRSCVYRIPNVGTRGLPEQRVMYYG